MTDLESFVRKDGRAELVREVRSRIKDLGITYLYYQFVSVTGRIMGKGIPADHWESVAERGFQLVYGSTANLFVDRSKNYIGYGPEAWELVGIPEPETFCQLHWDKRVARVYCTLFRGREEPENPGGYLGSDFRGNLRRVQEQFMRDHDGLHLRHGCEPEMMWLKLDEKGGPAGGYSKPFCYHINQFESLRPIFLRVIEYSRQMGLDMIQGDHEDAPGQLELNFMFDEALRTADRLTTYRQICAAVGREFNVLPCFMCKPFMGVSANGCHHNISVWRGGEEELNELGNASLPGLKQAFSYRKGGKNLFMPEDNDPRVPPEAVVDQLLSHIDGVDPRCTLSEQAVGESPRRRADVQRGFPLAGKPEIFQRSLELDAAAGHEGTRGGRESDRLVFPDLRAALGDDGAAEQDAPGEDQPLGLRTRFRQPPGDHRGVQAAARNLFRGGIRQSFRAWTGCR